MTDPLRDIEDRKAQEDIGVVAIRVYHGALQEGATRREAFWILVAWFVAMIKSSQDESDPEAERE